MSSVNESQHDQSVDHYRQSIIPEEDSIMEQSIRESNRQEEVKDAIEPEERESSNQLI